VDFHPYAETYPMLEGEEYDSFKADIAAGKGPREPVRYRMVRGKKQGLDGRNRLKACDDIGIKCPTKLVNVKDKDVETYIDALNLHRRHLSAEVRKIRVQKMRSQGKSTRQIAGALGVSPQTVLNDANPTVQNLTVENGSTTSNGAENSAATSGTPPTEPEVVVGKDGKKRKARTKKKKPDAPAEDPPSLTDSLDAAVPPGLVTVFKGAEDFKKIVNDLNAMNRKLKEMADSPAGVSLKERLPQAQTDLKNLKETVRFDMPYAVCPVCKGIAKTRKANCPCKNKGWLVEGAYKNLPAEFRE
jgi:Homeodomain-like domain